VKLPESFTKVTLLSKILAILLFVSLPFIGFYFGVKYQKSLTDINFYRDIIELNPSPSIITPTSNLPSPSIPSVSPDPINKQITYIDNFKINFSYQLPPGWSAKKENDKSPIIDDTRIIEVLKITKGDYLIHVGGLQTGVAPCSENIAPHYEYIKLINPHISPVVLREVPNQRDLEIFGEYRIDVCSQIDESSDNTPLTTTIFGGIIYKIPTNYDDEILKEMDSIIESIKPL